MFLGVVVIKLKNVTSKRQDIVSGLKAHSPEIRVVNVYEYESARYIHSIDDDSQTLSISCSNGKVSESHWILGIKEIMKMNLLEVMISVRSSGVVIITEKPDSIPRIAYNCR